MTEIQAVTLTQDGSGRWSWSDSITTSYGWSTPQAALADYMARYGYEAASAAAKVRERSHDHGH